MGKSMILKDIPPDIYEHIMEVQTEIKKSRGTNQFSMSSTIYYIIRKHINQTNGTKSRNNKP